MSGYIEFDEEYFYEMCDRKRKEAVVECLKILHSIGGCDATEEWEKGFDAAIDTAFEEIRKRFGIDTEEALDD